MRSQSQETDQDWKCCPHCSCAWWQHNTWRNLFSLLHCLSSRHSCQSLHLCCFWSFLSTFLNLLWVWLQLSTWGMTVRYESKLWMWAMHMSYEHKVWTLNMRNKSEVWTQDLNMRLNVRNKLKSWMWCVIYSMKSECALLTDIWMWALNETVNYEVEW